MGPVLVLGNGEKPAVREAVAKYKARLEKDFGIVDIDLEGREVRDIERAKWALVFGGDGMMLSASHRMGKEAIPTIGVNFGRLGFLTEVEYTQLGDALDRIQEGRVQVRERIRLLAKVGNWECRALNDVVVTGMQSGRVFHVSAKIAGHEALRYAGDGVVIATPTGSTAYSMAAGGPILDPELDATVITPLCAHALSQRPLVIPATDTIELYLRKEGDPVGRVVVDGQVSWELRHDQRLRVRRSKHPFLFLRAGMRSYFSRMRKLLGWGGLPRYSK